MEPKRGGLQASQKGPAEFFTGTVRIDPPNAPLEAARRSCALVTLAGRQEGALS